MDSDGDAVYCTLLLSDHYLPGAMVLAHSLRDNGTKAKLVALFTPDTLQTATVNELRTVYDELVPVHSIANSTPANLWLMERPDLVTTFTKIELWRLTQYRRIVYIDCDVVAMRAPDELLSLEADFAAAPDVGWPDCFNSGLMVLRPNLQDYYALKALADRGISFDGADQGLLNMHFRDWHRLSFTYNCTPSANYQYIPAYKHFQSTISLIHFIGAQKPWTLPRQVVPLESPYNQLLAHWWGIYDKHYRPPFVTAHQPHNPPSYSSGGHYVPAAEMGTGTGPVQSTRRATSGLAIFQDEWPEKHQVHSPDVPASSHHEETPLLVSTQGVPPDTQQTHPIGHHTDYSTGTVVSLPVPVLSVVPQYVRGEEHVSTYIPPLPHASAPIISHETQPSLEVQNQPAHTHHIPHEDGIQQPQPTRPVPPVDEPYQRPPSPTPASPIFEAPKAEWDASREPPPLNSKPEGISLQQKTYTMSKDTELFQPPPSYPEAPRNMYYQVPVTRPEPKKLAQLFPWEGRAPKPTRVFAEEFPRPEVSSPNPVSELATGTAESAMEPSLSPQSATQASESWDSYTRSNAWDEDPDIQRYMHSMQQARRGRPQVISGSGSSPPLTGSATDHIPVPASSRPSIKLTDFPTEVERPSLPVTPAPIHPSFFSGADDDDDEDRATALPIAEGVPSQEDWNPLVRLEELRRRQSDVLGDPEHVLSRLVAWEARADQAGDGSGGERSSETDDRGR
ncbi:hypothetical protein N7474_004350 [Penicillium riverlandense]|uniref:uncharacterized protein n=1 Tax=Penicillium riverlandense TaxID=1903569 RepID=UPI002549A22A|nr:uncharacterized protein N7474_004350 [Penicillium riverlandense]KAJ5818759.1 hypothetical protein N7474_004350 [Penicillium riverlandense]